MRLSSLKEIDTRKRYLTFGRIGAILGIHLLVFGGGYVVTQFGEDSDESKTSYAGANGIVNWSNQGADANRPTVDGTADSLFDTRSGDLAGYNVGGPRVMQIASAQTSESRGSRYAPRRPASSDSDAGSRSSSNVSDDSVLQPLNSNSRSPTANPIRPSGIPSSSIDYKVQNGDSLWGISKRFNVSVSEIVAQNPGIKADSIRVGQIVKVPRTTETVESSPASSSAAAPRAAPANGSIYVVKSGDSLSRIASRQGVTVAELRSANGLSTDMIRIGQELVVPSSSGQSKLSSRQYTGSKYVVEPGDTLDKIAAVYGVSINELKVLNEIADPRLIKIGQTLLIPESRKNEVTASTKKPPSRTGTVRSPVVRNEPTLQTLDDLESEEDSLPSLGDLETLSEFDEEDLDEAPMIPIQD